MNFRFRIDAPPLFLFLLISLTSCGGGGSEQPGKEDISDAKHRVDQLYSGVDYPAGLSYDNAAYWLRLVKDVTEVSLLTGMSSSGVSSNRSGTRLHALSAFFLGGDVPIKRVAQRSADKASKKPVEVDEVVHCEQGSAYITGNLVPEDVGTSSLFLTLKYDRCLMAGEEIDGEVRLIDVLFDPYGSPDEQFSYGTYAFHDLRIKSDSVDSTYNGTVETKFFSATVEDEGEISDVGVLLYLLEKNNVTGEQFKFQNVSRVVFENPWEKKPNPDAIVGKIEGRIYSSVNGYVDVSTWGDAGLLYLWPFYEMGKEPNGYPSEGGIRINGSGGASVTVTALESGKLLMGFDLSQDPEKNSSYLVGWDYLWSDLATDFADDDGDGVPNSWELYYGLDPNDASDASQDPDGDGYSSWMEFRGMSNPLDYFSIPERTNLVVVKYLAPGARIHEVIKGETLTLEFALSVSAEDGIVGADGVVPVFRLPNESRIASVYYYDQSFTRRDVSFSCVSEGGSPVCRFDRKLFVDIGETLHFYIEVVAPDSAGEYSVTIEANPINFDLDSEDNFTSIVFKALEPSADLSVIVQHNYSTVATAFLETEFDLSFNVTVKMPLGLVLDDLDLIVHIPQDIEPVLEIQEGEYWECADESSGQVCTYRLSPTTGYYTSNYWTPILTLRSLSNSFVGPVFVTASVQSSVYDPITDNNSARIPVFVGTSTVEVQHAVDTAQPGDIIQLPPGNYIGGLNLGSKSIHLASTHGASQTYLVLSGGGVYSDSYVVPGVDRSIKGFTFVSSRGGAGYVSLTAVSEFSDNIADGMEGYVVDVSLSFSPLNGRTKVERNVFIGSTLSVNTPSIVRNNVFTDPHRILGEDLFWTVSLLELSYYGDSVSTHSIVSNNVFANGIQGAYLADPVVFSNNIVAGMSAFGTIDGYGVNVRGGVFSSPDTVWSNNIFYDNSNNYYYSSATGTGSVDHLAGTENDLYVDPMFVDVLAGDFHVQPGSPAIDGGVPDGAPAEDLENTPRPLDGDGDGTAVVDIGAYEAPAH